MDSAQAFQQAAAAAIQSQLGFASICIDDVAVEVDDTLDDRATVRSYKAQLRPNPDVQLEGYIQKPRSGKGSAMVDAWLEGDLILSGKSLHFIINDGVVALS